MSQTGVVGYLEEKAFLQLIDYYEGEYMLDRALEVSDHALEHHQFSSDLYIRKAALLLTCHREEQALLLLEQAEILAPSELEIALLRAEAFSLQERHTEALDILESLKDMALPEELGDIYETEALVYENQEQYERMFYALRAALTHNPNHLPALERIWVCVELSKKYVESIALHEAILEENAYSYMAWYNLGQAQSYLCQYEEAIEAYEFAFLINEKFEPAYRDYAELCFELQRFEDALKCYEEMLEHFEVDSELLLRIGQCYLYVNDFAKCRRFLNRTSRLDPLNDEVFFYLGESYAKEGNWKKAITFYKKAIHIEYCREEYFAALAQAYFQLGDYELADTYFNEATTTAPEQVQYWFQYVNFLIATGAHDQAFEVLEEAEEAVAGTELSCCRVACLLASGSRKEALDLLAETLEEDAEVYSILFELAPDLKKDREVLAVVSSFLEE